MRVAQMFGLMMVTFLVLISSVMAAPGGVAITTPCHNYTATYAGDLTHLEIRNDCTGVSVTWKNWVNLSVFGDVVNGEVEVGDTWAYVDSVMRPDLDEAATLTFLRTPFAVEPNVLNDGTTCGSPDCNMTFTQGHVVLEVAGFSNYSLSAKKEFMVYSDQQPELKDKVYQTIDLGDAARDTEYSCLVQIYGLNENGQYVLVQTNPKRSLQARIMGSPDLQQPESLGYFPTKAGMVNVYFDGGALSGYNDFEYVAQCSSNSTKLVYEEPISTRYSPVGRTMVGRGIWLSNGANLFYIIIAVVIGVIALLLVMKFGRTVGWWR